MPFHLVFVLMYTLIIARLSLFYLVSNVCQVMIISSFRPGGCCKECGDAWFMSRYGVDLTEAKLEDFDV
jgi:hypothetical protein